MENTEEMITLLGRIPDPAFFAVHGIVTAVNEPARQRQILVGSEVLPMLVTGRDEYRFLRSGSLYLSAKVCGVPCGFCVTKMDDRELFVLEQDADQTELRSMALAAKTMRTSLSNVMATADRLFPLTRCDDTPEARDEIGRLNKGLYQMMRVVCNMSDAYRYGSDSTLRGEIRDISALMQEFFDRSAPLIEHTGIQLEYTGLPETVFTLVDAEKLERAVANILSNALKFTAPGGVILAKLNRRGKMLFLTVQDSGSGKPLPPKGNLYTQYLRQPGLEDSRFGVGLGMVLIRQAATAHGGTVLMENGPDFGLRLTMTLPIRQSSDGMVRSPMIHVDYAGGLDHWLIELSDALPAQLYQCKEIC